MYGRMMHRLHAVWVPMGRPPEHACRRASAVPPTPHTYLLREPLGVVARPRGVDAHHLHEAAEELLGLAALLRSLQGRGGARHTSEGDDHTHRQGRRLGWVQR